jgi:hypothetical protein
VNLTVAVAPPNASLGGIWYASTANSPNPSIPNVYAISDNQGNFAAVDYTNGCQGLYVGQLQANINNVTGVGLFSPDELDPVSVVNCIGSQALQFSGTISQQSSVTLSATGSVNGPLGSVTFTFNPLYNTPSSIASIQGNNWTDGYGGGVLVINPDGTFFEQNIVTGCVLNGTIIINDPTVNIYNFTATYASCVPPYNVANGLTIVGMGYYNPARPDGTQGLEFWYLGEQIGSSSTVFGYTIFTRP